MVKTRAIALGILTLGSVLWAGHMTARARPRAAGDPWSHVHTPAPGPARVIGGYSDGCLQGAVRLPLHGPGFRVMEPKRRHFFGHPTLIAFIRHLGTEVHAEKLGFLPIGDLAQPRGGPTTTGHASHQTGLDVDIWYQAAGDHQLHPLPMVNSATKQPTRYFDHRVKRILALAASDPHVDRIFVNPVLKRSLCQKEARNKQPLPWLHKLRPWWGHADHFHVRLECPAKSPACRPQPPVPPGDGCAQVNWWFRPKSHSARARQLKDYEHRVHSLPPLPKKCHQVLTE